MSTKWKIVIAILILVVTLFLNFVLSMAVGVSIISEVTVAINEEEPTEEPADEDIENMSTNYDTTEYVIGENCFDELHKLILQTDLDKISNTDNFIDTKKVVPIVDSNGNPYPIKAYLNLYALASEICLREEINPKGSDVVIEPMDLIGECCIESGLNNYGSELSQSALIWRSREILEQGVSSEILELQPGADWGDAWDNSSQAHAYGLANCPSFFGQAMMYSYCWEDIGDAHACIYISTAENPDLDASKRAVWGCRKDIYGGKGKYISEGFWENQDKLALASYDELRSSIKQGIFEKGKEFGYQTRPASYFLSDSMYTHAIVIRSFLRDRLKGSTSIHRVDPTGYWSTSNFDKRYAELYGTLDAEQKKCLGIAKKMYVLTRYTGDSQYDSVGICDSSQSPPGDLVKIYLELVNKKSILIDPTKDMVLWHGLLGKPGSICYVYVHGGSDIDPNLEHKLNLESSVISSDADIGGWGNHTMYGFDCINAGNLLKPAFEAQIRGAYRAYPKSIQQSQPKPTEKKQSSSNLCWPLSGSYTTIAAEGYYGKRKGYFHPGIDITVTAGEPVYSIASGTVLEVGQTDSADDFGIINYIIIEHDTYKNYKFCSMYSNIKTDLSVGDKVTQHQTIGTIRSYTAETYVDVISQEQGIPEVDAARKSFLHFTVYLYNPDSEIATISDLSGAWLMDNNYLFSYRFNPVYLDWYNGTSDTASKITPKAHTGEDLITSYENCRGYDDSCNIWEVSFNSKDPGDPECSIDNLEEEINAWHTNESYNIYGYDFNISSSYNVTIDDTSLSYEEVVSNIVQSSYSKSESESKLNAEGVTGLFGVKCVPPLPEEYFNEDILSQYYGNPGEGALLGGQAVQAEAHAGTDFGFGGKWQDPGDGSGIPIYAVADATVIFATDGNIDHKIEGQGIQGLYEGYGNQVCLLLDDCGWIVLYGHMRYNSLPLVGSDRHKLSAGDKVKAGDRIGYVGHTGASTAGHLHFEVSFPNTKIDSLAIAKPEGYSKPCRRWNETWYSSIVSGIEQPDLKIRRPVDPWLLYCCSDKYDSIHSIYVTFALDGIIMSPEDAEFRRRYRS